ncbi:guanylate kinase [Puccinia sorghi]|uniref:Guanylate kinase n=1 Tax=Puccinia sorghi TaxID=27349 RepID=A0A0L6VDW4_9BASI|nr:guanylate kinase [Puccinia sorghi]
MAVSPSLQPIVVFDTTRQPRPGEQDGVAYHFVSREKFASMIEQGEFIEHAEFGGNCYGTSLAAVQQVSEHQKKRCILDIDAQGVKLIIKNHPCLNPLIIFVCPPSLETLRKRLEARGTESPESLQSRLAMAQSEIDYAKSGSPHLVIVNNDLDQAYHKFHLACTDKMFYGTVDRLQKDEDTAATKSRHGCNKI